MSAVIKIIKRVDKAGADTLPAVVELPVQSPKSEIVSTVKSWIAESRDRRRAEAEHAAGLMQTTRLNRVAASQFLSLRNKLTCEGGTNCVAFFLAAAFVLFVAPGLGGAQELDASSLQTLTLDRAIDLALQNNHLVKIAQLGVDRADEDVSVAKTFRFPALHAYTLVSGNLAKNEIQVANPAPNLFPGLGSFLTLTQDRKPTAIFAVSAIQPVTQQYRIGLSIKLEKLAREMTQSKLRQQQNDTVDEVKKAYYAVLQTKSALSSEREALKAYQQLDKVTGDYVIQQVALKADYLVVQTRLAQSQYQELELSNKLATQKEQLNSLLGRDVTTEFEVAGVPEFVKFETDLTAARKLALERRPELQQATLTLEQATLARRIKKSEYIPDVSVGFTYLTPRNFDSVVPKNFANVGVVVSWEFFDWGRKKHQLAEKDHAIEQAKNGLKETEEKVLIDVGDKLRKLQLTGQALRVAGLAEASAKENLRVSTSKYGYQAVLLSDVLQSQASLAEASHEYQRALLAFWTAKAELEKALGEDK
jgi:outer membrane protein TolC